MQRDSKRAPAAASVTSIRPRLGMTSKPVLSSLPKRNYAHRCSPCLPSLHRSLPCEHTNSTTAYTLFSTHNDVDEPSRFAKPLPKRVTTVGKVCMNVTVCKNRHQCRLCALTMLYPGHPFQHGSNMLKAVPPLISSEVI